MSLNELAQECHETSKSKGFWDNPSEFGTNMALVTSEVSEAFEEYRSGREPHEVYYEVSPHDMKPCGIPTEFADIIIRTLDLCAYYGIDIDTVMKIKMGYNKTRPHRHGGKLV